MAELYDGIIEINLWDSGPQALDKIFGESTRLVGPLYDLTVWHSLQGFT